MAVKNDFKDGKLRWDLLPLEEIEDIVEVYTAGANKYGDNKWQDLDNGYQRYKAAMLRHLLEYEKGSRVDQETGCKHLAQVAWNAIAMLYLDKHGRGKGERQDIRKNNQGTSTNTIRRWLVHSREEFKRRLQRLLLSRQTVLSSAS